MPRDPRLDESLIVRLERAADRLADAPDAPCYDDEIAELRRRDAEHDLAIEEMRRAATKEREAREALTAENARHALALAEIEQHRRDAITAEQAVAEVKKPLKDAAWKVIATLAGAAILAAAAKLWR